LITPRQVDLYERLTDLALKVALFLFVLLGVAVMTSVFIYCILAGKSFAAKAVFGFGDTVFFGTFAVLVKYFFTKPKPEPDIKALPEPEFISKENFLP